MSIGLNRPHSFVSFVNLESHIVWSGKIASKWEEAKAVAVLHSGEELTVFADGYRLTLRKLGGQEKKKILGW